MQRLDFNLSREDYTSMLSSNINDPNRINQWETDTEFNKITKDTSSLVDQIRLYMLYQLASHTSCLVDGDVAEVGVYKGGSAKLLGEVFKTNSIHLFDTFEGMPKVDSEKDFHKEGDFKASLLETQEYLKEYKNINFYKGLFPETAGPIEDKTFRFVHVDVDIYKSIYDCCTFFYQRMVPGGIIISDDYGCITCPGAKKGMDDFFDQVPETPIYLPRGQAFIVKIGG
jgi:O-methyltransferase